MSFPWDRVRKAVGSGLLWSVGRLTAWYPLSVMSLMRSASQGPGDQQMPCKDSAHSGIERRQASEDIRGTETAETHGGLDKAAGVDSRGAADDPLSVTLGCNGELILVWRYFQGPGQDGK